MDGQTNLGGLIFAVALCWAGILLFPVVAPYWPLMVIGFLAFCAWRAVKEDGLLKVLLVLAFMVIVLGSFAAIFYLYFVRHDPSGATLAAIVSITFGYLYDFLERRKVV